MLTKQLSSAFWQTRVERLCLYFVNKQLQHQQNKRKERNTYLPTFSKAPMAHSMATRPSESRKPCTQSLVAFCNTALNAFNIDKPIFSGPP